MELAVGVQNSERDSLGKQDKWERCGDDHHSAAWWARMEGATEEGIKHFFRWRGAEGPKKMDGELRLASSTCRMCDVGHFAHTLPLCSLPRMDLWQKFPFRRPSRVSDSSKSRVRVILFDTLRDPLWRVSGNWSFTEYGYGACTEISRVYGYIPENKFWKYPCRNPLGEA